MHPENCIFFQLAKASQAGARYWQEKVSRFGVTSVQGMILAFLAEEDAITSGRLGHKVHLDSATLTGILDRLTKAELVERQSNPHDRRAILICLTDKGKTIAKEINGMIQQENRAFLSGLTEEEEMIFRTLLRKILKQGRHP